MSKDTSNQKTNVVAKAGLWYTICNFLFRGMAFITTPIFTRLLSKGELGSFSNLLSWVSILSVVTAFDLAHSIIRSKLEHEDDIDSYVWSILSFSSIWTLLVYGIVCLFPDFFSNLMEIDVKYIHIMFLYLFLSPAYSMLITKHRAFYKYKLFVLLTGIMTVSSTLLSLLMVILMQDKLMGRALGYFIPHLLISGVIFLHLMIKGKKVKVKYWKYACVICLPLVPHVLSLYLLSSADKILLTRLCGVEYTAIYSVAYSAYHIATILFDSMNKAWAPWLLESLHLKKYAEIKKTSKIYILVFVLLILGVLLLVPEVILILGGRQYMDAVHCLPPLLTCCVFQFIYTMYVNIEFYQKKTIGVSLATITATTINIALDLIILPHFPTQGYIITAYTTLVGYIVLFFLHYGIVRKMGMDHVYDTRYIVSVLFAVMAIALLANVLYRINVIRWIIILAYCIVLMCIAYKYKDVIFGLLRKKSKRKA